VLAKAKFTQGQEEAVQLHEKQAHLSMPFNIKLQSVSLKPQLSCQCAPKQRWLPNTLTIRRRLSFVTRRHGFFSEM